MGDVQDSQGVSASKMTDIVSGGSVYSLLPCFQVTFIVTGGSYELRYYVCWR